ncbi:MAG: extracellular solute-binding protein [Trueperaceae bacterium]
MKRGISLLTIALAALTLGTAAFAQTLTITCRCIADGVNNNTVRWIEEVVIPGFEAQHDGVNVELAQFGGTDEALKEQYALDLSVGGGADVMSFDGFWVPEFVAGGLLEPLSAAGGESASSWEGWEHIPDGLEELLSYDGERYGIALGTDYRMFFYRKDMLEEAGVENADNWQPQSWEEVLDAARAVKETFPDSAPLQINAGTAMGEATTMQGYFPMLLGTGHFLLDDQGRWIVRSQGILDTLNLYKTIYLDEELGDARLQLVQDGRNRSFANFRDGVTAILLEGDYFYRGPTAPDQEFAVENRDEVMGWAPIPAQEPGEGFRGQDIVTISGGTGYVVNPNSDNPELAWELLAYMNSTESLMGAQEIEPRIRVRDDVPVPDSEYLTETAAELGQYTTARPNDPAYPQISYEAQLMTERVVSGEMTPEEAMDAYASAVTDIVGEENVVDQLD